MFNIFAMGCHLKRANQRTFAARVPCLVPIEECDRVRGGVGKECRAANLGGERVDYDLVAPSVATL
jgi:hypothetical protein